MKGFLQCSLVCLLELFGTTSVSALPIAHKISSSGAIIADLPSIRFPRATPPLAFSVSGREGASKTSPLLDQLFGKQELTSHYVHRRSYHWEVGGATLGIETLRLQSTPGNRLGAGLDAGSRSKSWSVGARSDWPIGTNDRMSFGLAATSEHSMQPQILASNPRTVTSVKTLGVTWLHGDRWQLSAGWQQTGGGSRGGTDRMVELASGAPLHEKGMRFSLAFLPGSMTDPHHTSLALQLHSSFEVSSSGSGLVRASPA